jgi:O-antigen/teichoic acid export membrane protein
MIMAVLAPFGGAASLGYFFQPVMAAAGKTQMISLYTLSTLLTNLIVALAAAPFGVVAVALGFTLRAHAGVPFGLLLLQRAIGIPPLEVLKRLAPAFSAATVMALILIAVRQFALAEFSPLSRLCLLVALGAALYAGQLCLLHRRYLRSVWSDLAPSIAALPSRRK